MNRTINLIFILLCSVSISKAQSGNIDYSFATDFSCNQNSFMLPAVVQKDGKVVVGGLFTISFFGTPKITHLARLNKDGTLDESFKMGTGVNGYVNYMYTLPDDRIFISGYFDQFDGKKCHGPIILFPDGHLDTSFHTPYYANIREIYDIAVQSDSKILAYGKDGDKAQRAALIRLNADGNVDTSFKKVHVLAKDGPLDVFPLKGGNVLFSAQDTTYKMKFYLVNSKGIIDESLFKLDNNIGFAQSNIACAAEQEDEKIIISGNIFLNDISFYIYAMRLHKNGSIDTSFVLDDAFKFMNSVQIQTTFIQKDGKIILGGFFQWDHGVKTSTLMRIYPNGRIDTSFNVEDGFNLPVRNIVRYNDSKIIVTGAFQNYNSFFTTNVARVNTEVEPTEFELKVISNPNNGLFHLVANMPLKEVKVYDALGKTILTNTYNTKEILMDISTQASGVYFVNVKGEKEKRILKILKL